MTADDPSAFHLVFILLYKCARVATLVPCLVLVGIAVHELGHVAAAKLMGFRVPLVRISIFTFFADEDGWAVLAKPRREDFFTGLISAFPTRDRALALRTCVLLAGGAAANLLVAALSLYLVWFAIGHWMEYVLILNMLVSMVIAGLSLVVTDVETMTGRTRSDGAQIEALANRSTRAEELTSWRLEMLPWGCLIGGQTATSSGATVEALEGLALVSGSPAWARFLAGLLACENRQYSNARRLLTESLSESNGPKSPRSQSGYLLALLDALDGDVRSAQLRLCWNNVTARGSVEPPSLCLIQAAILAEQGAREDAQRALERWDRYVAEKPGLRGLVRGLGSWARDEIVSRLESQESPVLQKPN